MHYSYQLSVGNTPHKCQNNDKFTDGLFILRPMLPLCIAGMSFWELNTFSGISGIFFVVISSCMTGSSYA